MASGLNTVLDLELLVMFSTCSSWLAAVRTDGVRSFGRGEPEQVVREFGFPGLPANGSYPLYITLR